MNENLPWSSVSNLVTKYWCGALYAVPCWYCIVLVGSSGNVPQFVRRFCNELMSKIFWIQKSSFCEISYHRAHKLKFGYNEKWSYQLHLQMDLRFTLGGYLI